MTVKTIEDRGAWDVFVDESPHGSIFHKWDFLKIVEKHTGYQLLTYGVYLGNKLICVFPVFLRDQMGLRSLFSPPPSSAISQLGFIMGPAYDAVKQQRREAYMESVANGMCEEFKKLAPGYVSIVLVPDFYDIRPFKWNGYDVGIGYDYRISLEKPLEEIWGGLSDSLKKNIKACSRRSLEMREVEDVDAFYGLMRDRYLAQGLNLPIASAEYLGDLLHAYPENIKLYFLYDNDSIVAANLVCNYRGTLTLWIGGATLQREFPANDFCNWELIRIAKERYGIKTLLWEGANTRRLCDYKSKYNPTLKPYYYFYRKNSLGKMAEYAYRSLVKKKIF